MWGEKSVYKSKLSPCPTTHRLDMTRPSQVISNPQAQVLETLHLLQGTTVDYNNYCETQLAGVTPGDAHRLRFSLRWFEEIHSQMRSTSSCSSCMSERELGGLKSRMSSAYTSKVESFDSCMLKISLIYSKKNIGPKIEPWGTPETTGNNAWGCTATKDNSLETLLEVVGKPGMGSRDIGL